MTMATAAEKLDLYKTHKNDYAATKDPKILKISRAKYLTIEGHGEPGGTEFQNRLGALYAVAYTIKMTEKFAGRDYKVCGLEGLWWVPDGKNWNAAARETWQWNLIIRVPEFITSKHLKAALEKCAAKGRTEPVGEVRLEEIAEGRCVQMLHVGPYATEPESIRRMEESVAAQGLKLCGRHHEIYLSDPRRVPPERLKTILRHPVE